MEGFLRFLGWLFLIFLAYLIFGFDVRKRKQRIKELKEEYNKANAEYVRRYRENERLEKKARIRAKLFLLGFYSCVCASFAVICNLCHWEVLPTIIIGIGYYGLFASPLSHILFGKDMGASGLYNAIYYRVRNYLNKKNNFNAALLPVYLKKRDELRVELITLIKDYKKTY